MSIVKPAIAIAIAAAALFPSTDQASAEGTAKGFSSQVIPGYPKSNWTPYKFQNTGEKVSWDGKSDDTTGRIISVTIAYSKDTRVTVEKFNNGVVEIGTTNPNISVDKVISDIVTILNDPVEHARAINDLSPYVGLAVATKSANEMTSFAKDVLNQFYPKPNPPRCGNTTRDVAPHSGSPKC
jgi:hypothetical protein